eukprot:scaffold116262_cov66-Phaeocystis_antarctica.AAC.3
MPKANSKRYITSTLHAHASGARLDLEGRPVRRLKYPAVGEEHGGAHVLEAVLAAEARVEARHLELAVVVPQLVAGSDVAERLADDRGRALPHAPRALGEAHVEAAAVVRVVHRPRALVEEAARAVQAPEEVLKLLQHLLAL